MNYGKRLRITPGSRVRLQDFDPEFTDKHEKKTAALPTIQKLQQRMDELQFRLDDPARRWKISEADYSEREYWAGYEAAYEDALSKCSTDEAPWFVIPSDHKWFRDLAISQILVETMEKLGIELPEPTVNIADIRRKYHEAVGRPVTKKAASKK